MHICPLRAHFVTKHEIFKVSRQITFFKKYVSYSDRKYTPLLWKPVFQNLKSELRSFRVKRKPQKAFLGSGNFFHHFSEASRRNDFLNYFFRAEPVFGQ